MHPEPIVPIPPPPPATPEEEDLESEVDDLEPPVFATNTYVFDYYRVAVPPGFAEHYSEYFLHTLVTNRSPRDVSRIIPIGVDYNDHREYIETPIHMQIVVGPNEHQNDPQWTVTWECYGVTEQTKEPESMMRRHYPNFFDD
ncbi:hypothetical protein RHMOL_Rhmol03G0008200 [Rhododendron molle]|uniref:Uncharacterized protein n=2 Tax=Rhododendron molle TaxID=49168 RepID=A0ACC0N3G9_RHOML|nr:hypothetical protein RHMOL_Rhmol07G0180900 [Rhododendron molle]KAI8562097.1 hypothetical protein RHMOL_Rhmol03G0008200 [Rhododendron molle]